jgi:sialate O-acetylesterase
MVLKYNQKNCCLPKERTQNERPLTHNSTSNSPDTLPRIFDSNMVFQQGKPLPVWGWAQAGENVTVTLLARSQRTKADEDGRWMVKLRKMKAGGPYEMTIKGNNIIKLSNIMVGEVWLCSGQSNMEWSVQRGNDPEQEIAKADYPNIRLFHVTKKQSVRPLSDVEADWQICTPKTVRSFSAVGYFFGRTLQADLDVPIGLIEAAWGGTRIEPWTPPVGFEQVPALKEIVDQIAEAEPQFRSDAAEAIVEYDSWLTKAKQALKTDSEIPGPPKWPTHPLLTSKQQPIGLYNAMIHPLIPFAIRGAIWYQGESNCFQKDRMLYYEKTKALVGGWRKLWDQGDFPFYYVQLAPYLYSPRNDAIEPTELALFWEAQTACLTIKNTGMAVTVDIGNVKDIHPRNKQDVGKRLALWALAKDYGKKKLVYSGPLYKSMSVKGSKVRIKFNHTGSGLISRDGEELSWFEIAGSDRQFVKADAKIDGKTVLVSSPTVAKPVAVRFGWNEEAEPNLSNKEGLPASPFRTDKW